MTTGLRVGLLVALSFPTLEFSILEKEECGNRGVGINADKNTDVDEDGF